MTTTNMTAFLLRPLRARDPEEKHRAATPLELLYDLVLVIAVGAAAAILHHAINENHAAAGLGAFLFMFWALWWPWVNFTWFASAYDNDDALYRCLVFRSEEHTSELQSLMRISYAVFCLKKKNKQQT